MRRRDAILGNGIAHEKTLTFFKESTGAASFTLKLIILAEDAALIQLSSKTIPYSINELIDKKNSGIKSFNPGRHSQTLTHIQQKKQSDSKSAATA